MRRVLLAVVTTVTGLVVLLGFKTTPLSTTAVAAGPAATAPASPDGEPARLEVPDTSGAPAPTGRPGPTTFTGSSAATPYGQVQVSITVSDGRLTEVTPVSLPSREPRSVQASRSAAPVLAQDALSTQSADVDMVSGATYTSQGYRESLQSALDQAPPLTAQDRG